MEQKYKIETTENYYLKFGRTYLQLKTYAVEARSGGKRYLVDDRKIKLPKEVPTYITSKNLWHHTDYQLKELERLMKINEEKKPSKGTLQAWKSWLEMSG